MQITTNIEEKHDQEVVGAFCNTYGYSPMVGELGEEPQPNPETPVQFTERMLAEHVKSVVLAYRLKPVLAGARDTVKAAVDTMEIS